MSLSASLPETHDLQEGLGTISPILEVFAFRIKIPVIHYTLKGGGSCVRTRMAGESLGVGSTPYG